MDNQISKNNSHLKVGAYLLSGTIILIFIHAFILSYYIVHLQQTMHVKINAYLDSQFHFFALFFLLSELLIVAAIIFYVISILRHSVPLANFKALTSQLGIDINTPIQNNVKLPASLVNETTVAITQLQKRVQSLINTRTKILAAISHDLRVPLTRLRMRTELVEEKVFADEMLADIDEMSEMIKDILIYAQEDAFHEKKAVFNIHKTLKILYDNFKSIGHNIYYQSAQENMPIFGYEMAIKRVFNNLIDNAIKYSSQIEIQTEIKHDQLRILISDNGPGIPEEKIIHVFDAYYRADNRENGGVGLGLNTAQEILSICGGKIRLYNGKDYGLNVQIDLPLYKQ